jgi:hypothetical protein
VSGQQLANGFEMLGRADAVVCEGDACLIPGADDRSPAEAQAAVVAALDDDAA